MNYEQLEVLILQRQNKTQEEKKTLNQNMKNLNRMRIGHKMKKGVRNLSRNGMIYLDKIQIEREAQERRRFSQRSKTAKKKKINS